MSDTTAAPAPAEARVQSEQSKFVQHLATYPALSALAGLIASFPVAKIFVSNAVPLLHAIHERTKTVADPIAETAAPYLHKLDDAGDAALSRLDQRFPRLNTAQPADIYEDAQHYLGSVKGNAYAAYDSRIGKPLANVASAAREKIDSFNKHTAPEFEKVEKIYDDNLAKELEKNGKEPVSVDKLLAALATGKFLSVEGYHYVLQHYGSPESLEKAVSELKAKGASFAEEASAELKKDAQKVVDAI